ncbi:MAG: hypothetical protein V4736_01260 [Bdellovibrionota bacterium]
MRHGLFILFLLPAIMIPNLVWGKVFRNAYISFEMPDAWNCQLEQTEWVCRSQDSKESREAIIILTAKEVGPTDSFPLYETHLNNSITATTKSGGQIASKVVYKTKTVQINNQNWLDGLHLASEVNNYFTRYLATIKDKIAVLVTFSAHKDFYTKYSQDFFKSIMSMRIIATKDLFAKPSLGPLHPSSDTLGQGIANAFPADFQNEMETDTGGSNKKATIVGLIILLLAAAGYIFIKMKKKKK